MPDESEESKDSEESESDEEVAVRNLREGGNDRSDDTMQMDLSHNTRTDLEVSLWESNMNPST